MAEFLKGVPGSEPASLEKISEIIRGATIQGLETDKARDPDHNGEIVRLNLGGGDFLLFIAVPNPRFLVDPDAPSAKLQTVLIHRRYSTLKT